MAVLELCQGGMSLREACVAANVTRSNLYRQRALTELKIVEEEEFLRVLEQNPKASLLKLNAACKDRLNQSPWKQKHSDLQKNGDLLL